jgi:hypothetical protein
VKKKPCTSQAPAISLIPSIISLKQGRKDLTASRMHLCFDPKPDPVLNENKKGVN